MNRKVELLQVQVNDLQQLVHRLEVDAAIEANKSNVSLAKLKKELRDVQDQRSELTADAKKQTKQAAKLLSDTSKLESAKDALRLDTERQEKRRDGHFTAFNDLVAEVKSLKRLLQTKTDDCEMIDANFNRLLRSKNGYQEKHTELKERLKA